MIRLACGDGVRTPESLREFAARVLKETGVRYHPNALSLLERDEQGWGLDDINTFPKVDPKHRGPAWLAFGAAPEVTVVAPSREHRAPVANVAKTAKGAKAPSVAGTPATSPPQAVGLPDPTKDRKLTQQEIARAVRQADLEDRATAASASQRKKGGTRRR